jgi:hypothetical protein
LRILSTDETKFFDYGTTVKLITNEGKILCNKKNNLEIQEIADNESCLFQIITADNCDINQMHDWDHRIEISGPLRDAESKEQAIARLRDISFEERTNNNEIIVVVFLFLLLFLFSYHNWK